MQPGSGHLPLDRALQLLAKGVEGEDRGTHVQFKGVRHRNGRNTNPWSYSLPSNPTGTHVAPTQGDAVRERLRGMGKLTPELEALLAEGVDGGGAADHVPPAKRAKPAVEVKDELVDEHVDDEPDLEVVSKDNGAVPPAGSQPRPALPEARVYRAAHLLARRIKPRPLSTKPVPKVPVVEGRVPDDASILIIQKPWLDRILSGHKTLEIRSQPCHKVGQRIYLALSGGGGIVLGSVLLIACHGPLSRDEWTARADEHCVAGDKLPYGTSTYAWEVVQPQLFKEPVPYKAKRGQVIWAVFERTSE